MLKRIIHLITLVMAIPFYLIAQETNSSVGGIIKGANNQPLTGATISAVHNPTGTNYRVISKSEGRYDINNMQPGGPYTITISFVGFNTDKREDIFLNLGEKGRFDFVLANNSGNLSEVVVSSNRTATLGRGGTETNIGRDKVQNIPSISRNLNDYLRFTPQAKITGDGGISLAGQNNRFNAFYIDGAINNDVFGIAASGTNGGQANINPISIDAIDQFQVTLSPFDASIGGFTGGGINATTRSGTNTFNGSAWYYYRNEDLAGRTPGDIPKANRVKLGDLSNKIYGVRFGGPIIKNKLFFFVLGEIEKNTRPQPFNFAEYRGNTKLDSVNVLTNFLKNTYGYDAGSFLDNPEKVDAKRLTAKIDWNLNQSSKLTFSYRYNEGTRFNTSSSSSTTINFFNNGFIFPNKTHTATGELRSTFSGNKTNRLLLTYSDVLDNRDPIGQAFPRVTITDGSGRFILGTENFSTGNFLSQKNWTLYDAFKFNAGKHLFTVGTDNLYSKAYNLFVRDLYGSYTYATLSDFIAGNRPTRYDRTFSLLENKTDEANSPSAAAFKYFNLAFFVNDEIKATDRLTLNFGIRADKSIFPDKPRGDNFFNDTALAILSQNYNLRGARSGQMADVPWSISPRAGFNYRIDEERITVRGGIGYFTGRMPLVWPGGVYNNTGVNLGTVGVNNPNITFRPDVNNQYGPQDFNISLANAKGQVDLISKEFKLPKIVRTTLAIDKQFGRGWKFTLEGLYSKNINEIYYQNINIIPSALKSNGAGSRTVYTFSGTPARPGLRGNINPYSGGEIFLLYNNPDRKGYSYNFSASLDKSFSNGWASNVSYTYGNSVVTYEVTSSQNNSQWRNMESVNGRNFVGLSTSDFDLGHRVYAYGSKRFNYAKNGLATTVSLVYNGQQGQPFSYVYNGGFVGDRSRAEFNDLIYIPTATELQAQTFLTNTVSGVAYTATQQKQLLEDYINKDSYLRNRRGQFAERNGARVPWSHIIDLKLQQDFNLKIGKKTYSLQLTYDVNNFTNMINRNWGKTYFIGFDQYALLSFAGFVSATDLTPQYRFSPQTGKPYSLSTSSQPGYSARWISQIGLRVNF